MIDLPVIGEMTDELVDITIMRESKVPVVGGMTDIPVGVSGEF